MLQPLKDNWFIILLCLGIALASSQRGERPCGVRCNTISEKVRILR